MNEPLPDCPESLKQPLHSGDYFEECRRTDMYHACVYCILAILFLMAVSVYCWADYEITKRERLERERLIQAVERISHDRTR